MYLIHTVFNNLNKKFKNLSSLKTAYLLVYDENENKKLIKKEVIPPTVNLDFLCYS